MTSEPDAKLDRIPAARQEASPQDRRQAPRFRLRDARGSMSWQGEAGVVDFEVVVLNLSGGGAAVLAEIAPPAGQAVRLCLPCEPARMDPVEAIALSSSADPTGKQLVRIRFAHWIPLDAILEKHRERRLWERYPARASRATLTWMDGTTEASTHGDLLNISGGGVAFVGDVLPPPCIPIWLQIDTSIQQVPRIDPVEARLVATSVDPSGMTIAHIQFVAPCPLALFELVVTGSESGWPTPSPGGDRTRHQGPI